MPPGCWTTSCSSRQKDVDPKIMKTIPIPSCLSRATAGKRSLTTHLMALTLGLSLLAGMAQEAAIARSGTENRPALIPLPVKVERGSGEFVLTGKTTILTDATMSGVGRYLAGTLQPVTGFKLTCKQRSGQPSGAVTIRVSADMAGLGDEGYRLEVKPDRVEIAASKPAGAFYACQTLRQLLPPEIMGRQRPARDIRWAMPCVLIEDKPRFPWRGVLLDSARILSPQAVCAGFHRPDRGLQAQRDSVAPDRRRGLAVGDSRSIPSWSNRSASPWPG